jgi:TolB-like protein
MRGFIDELRYRNVFRVAAAYVVGSWLIAQVADLVTDAFSLPDWVMQMVIILLVLGLPVAVFLAWAFELTPEGVKKAHEVSEATPRDRGASRILNAVTIVMLLIAVSWLAWDKIHRSPAIIAPVDKSIAVLPFSDFSPDGNHSWFADGLTEEVLNSLARTTDLQVASRTSSFAFRDSTRNIPSIATELGVNYVLEGSVRRGEERLRVTSQLIHAANDKHLWSETFDGTTEDSIKIQEEIAFEIAAALQTTMDPDELARMVAAGTRSVKAWETYLRGLALKHEVSSRNDVHRVNEVIAVFDEAVSIDPSFADAQLQLADLWEKQLNPTATEYDPSGIPRAERRRRYDTAITAAIEHARSEMTRTEAKMRLAAFDLQLVEQIALAQRMAELEPDKRVGWSWLNHLYQIVGEFDKSVETGFKAWSLEASIDVSEGALISNTSRASAEKAVTLVEKALQSPNPSPSVIYQSHRALLAAGLVERAGGLIETYERTANDNDGLLLMQLRQACAEGRVADADEIYAAMDENSASQWLLLKTLGFDDQARGLLQPLDSPENLVALSGYLTYRNFEARDYPLLWSVLAAQGIVRPPARPLAYRCQR